MLFLSFVLMGGLEPPTFPISAECSEPTELHQQIKKQALHNFGGLLVLIHPRSQGRNRTCNSTILASDASYNNGFEPHFPMPGALYQFHHLTVCLNIIEWLIQVNVSSFECLDIITHKPDSRLQVWLTQLIVILSLTTLCYSRC